MARTLEQEVNLSRRACWKRFSASEDDRKVQQRKISMESHVSRLKAVDGNSSGTFGV
jgi:hypothetical protein